MPYPEIMIRPMREELARLGFEETKTPEQVAEAIEQTPGTVLVVVNSVCGCAAGKARPGIALALRQAATKPDRAITVFAGADVEATNKARGYFTGYRPSSPSIALLKDGQLAYIMERHQIEGKDAPAIADELTKAFAQHCADQAAVNA
ncbi:MAG: BrxA/BrxB family bacilliredoxin [Pyrinomonadaceae bacterium]